MCPKGFALFGSSKKDVDLLYWVLRRAMVRMVRRLEQLSCEEGLRGLGLFSLEWIRFWGDLSLRKVSL